MCFSKYILIFCIEIQGALAGSRLLSVWWRTTH